MERGSLPLPGEAYVLTPADAALLLAFVVFGVLACKQSSRPPSNRPLKVLSKQRHAVLITGAAHGIGRQLALKFSQVAPVVLLDVKPAGLATVASEIESARNSTLPSVVTVCCDVSNSIAIQKAVQQAQSELGIRIGTFISNAGIVNGKDVDQLTEFDVNRSMGVNVGATFNLLRELLPGFKAAQSGTIVVVASVMGMIGSSRLTDYCASKWALLGLMQSLRIELGRDGLYDCINSITVCPYAVRTQMFNGIYQNEKSRNLVRELFFPMLSEESVAQSIFDAVQRGGHQVLVLPRYFDTLLYIARLLMPLRWHDAFLGWCGGWHGMESFRGSGRDTNNDNGTDSGTVASIDAKMGAGSTSDVADAPAADIDVVGAASVAATNGTGSSDVGHSVRGSSIHRRRHSHGNAESALDRHG